MEALGTHGTRRYTKQQKETNRSQCIRLEARATDPGGNAPAQRLIQAPGSARFRRLQTWEFGAWQAPGSACSRLCACCKRLEAPGKRLIQAAALAKRLEAPVPGAWEAPDPGAFQATK